MTLYNYWVFCTFFKKLFTFLNTVFGLKLIIHKFRQFSRYWRTTLERVMCFIWSWIVCFIWSAIMYFMWSSNLRFLWSVFNGGESVGSLDVDFRFCCTSSRSNKFEEVMLSCSVLSTEKQGFWDILTIFNLIMSSSGCLLCQVGAVVFSSGHAFSHAEKRAGKT